MQIKETQFEQLHTKLLIMAAAAGIALEKACCSLQDGDAAQASEVIDGDIEINDLENEINELALSLIIRTQPVAHDLRFIIGALRMINDLERIGDEAVSIATWVATMNESFPRPIVQAITTLIHSAMTMFHQAHNCLRLNDKEGALELCQKDEQLTNEEIIALHEVMKHFCGKVDSKSDGLHYEGMNAILICRSLNRICRRCSNIGEHIYFVIDGVNIKYQLNRAGN